MALEPCDFVADDFLEEATFFILLAEAVEVVPDGEEATGLLLLLLF